ncbi:MAG: hypothetical protein ACTSX8_05110 [Alphaproteobacteria bacterium]
MDYKSEIRELTQQAINSWFYKWKREHVADINKRLDDSAREIIAVLLGMSGRWGRWEVDSSRAKDSAAGQFITRHADTAVRAWLEKLFANGLPEPTEEDLEAARDHYMESFRSQVRHAMYNKATSDANKFLEGVAADVIGDLSLDMPEEVALADSTQRLGKPE